MITDVYVIECVRTLHYVITHSQSLNLINDIDDYVYLKQKIIDEDANGIVTDFNALLIMLTFNEKETLYNAFEYYRVQCDPNDYEFFEAYSLLEDEI